MAKLKDLDCLQGKFFIFPRPVWWKIECMECDAKWRLEKSSQHVGNLLHLLNHYAGHEMKRDNPAEYERIQREQRQSPRRENKASAIKATLHMPEVEE